MSIVHKTHLESFRSHFELACIFAILITSADLIWVIRDIVINGIDFVYFIILLFLTVGNIGTILVVWKHHSKLVRKIRRTLLKNKLYLHKKARQHKERA